LWLRDQTSVDNLAIIGGTVSAEVGSDLAFLSEFWCPPSLFLAPRQPLRERPKVGVILRDWPAANPQAFGLQMLPTLERLSACFDLTLISLDAATDALTLQTLRSLRQIVWRPDRLGISDFMEKIAEQDVLLTARAHGAICGACVGRSSVILEIEPKLRTVHNMLPRVTSIVPPPYDADVIVARLEEALAVSHETIVAEVRRNTAESERALAAVLQGASA
ncbi:MAG TPA: polysaccharide pyruvyl transferase family protein, partial [Casimicrobium sp.]|nr:polysaccharide pyruvyl transferase family protein [Casimicrobium sp.]